MKMMKPTEEQLSYIMDIEEHLNGCEENPQHDV